LAIKQQIKQNSYFLNFTYWQLALKKETSYFDFAIPCFEDNKILAAHLSILQNMVNYAKSHDFPIVVVLFPFLTNIEESGFYMNVIKEFFAKNSIPVIDVGNLVSDLTIKERIVNKTDSHASVIVHKRIGEELYKVLSQNNYIRP